MSNLKKFFVSKVFSLLLIFSLAYGPYTFGDSKDTKSNFDYALMEYSQGLYEPAALKLELILSIKEKTDAESRAKVLLLLGACYEKTGKEDKAKETFLQLKEMVDKGLIGQVPAIVGVDTASLAAFKEIFAEKSFFNHKKPTVVSDMIKKNVVHAPRKSIDQKKKEKKKKKFPWLIAVGAVVIAGTVAILLASKKNSKEKELKIPEIEWVKIPAGDFLMGDNFNEGEADELPVHKVYLDEYYISKYEITIEQYHAFCDDTGRERLFTTNFLGDPVDPELDFPAYGITMNDAKAFCTWLANKTGENISLPTEAQWEKAARGTSRKRYPWGDRAPDCTLANFAGCGTYTTSDKGWPKSVGSLTGVSPYGVHDMAGNAAEWCLDRYDASYYAKSPEKNPRGPGSGSYYVVRGGSFESSSEDIRAAGRDFRLPNTKESAIGFRVVKN